MCIRVAGLSKVTEVVVIKVAEVVIRCWRWKEDKYDSWSVCGRWPGQCSTTVWCTFYKVLCFLLGPHRLQLLPLPWHVVRVQLAAHAPEIAAHVVQVVCVGVEVLHDRGLAVPQLEVLKDDGHQPPDLPGIHRVHQRAKDRNLDVGFMIRIQVQGSGFRVQGSGFTVQGSGSTQGSGFGALVPCHQPLVHLVSLFSPHLVVFCIKLGELV